MTTDFRKVNAPDFESNRLEFYAWHLRHHGDVYEAFRLLCDRYREAAPHRVLSADMICHVIRYQTGLAATDDTYDINNNLTPLFARLYHLERPDARFRNRTSWLDTLPPDEWQIILDAFEPLREKPSPTEGWGKLHERGQYHYARGRYTLCGLTAREGTRLYDAMPSDETTICADCLMRTHSGQRRTA